MFDQNSTTSSRRNSIDFSFFQCNNEPLNLNSNDNAFFPITPQTSFQKQQDIPNNGENDFNQHYGMSKFEADLFFNNNDCHAQNNSIMSFSNNQLPFQQQQQKVNQGQFFFQQQEPKEIQMQINYQLQQQQQQKQQEFPFENYLIDQEESSTSLNIQNKGSSHNRDQVKHNSNNFLQKEDHFEIFSSEQGIIFQNQEQVQNNNDEQKIQLDEKNEEQEIDDQDKRAPKKNYEGIFTVQKKPIKKFESKKKNYDKNICRYLTRKTVRCFMHEHYEKFVLNNLCQGDEALYDQVINYYFKRMETMTGFKALKEQLIIFEEDGQDVRTYKGIFKAFMKWFLKERIVRYILKGEMENKRSYIRYKNEVMLRYIDQPEKWNSNKNNNKKASQRKGSQ